MAGRQDLPALGICSVLDAAGAELWGLQGQDGSRALRGRRGTEYRRQAASPSKVDMNFPDTTCPQPLGRRSDRETRPSRGLQVDAGSGVTLYEIRSLDP